MNVGDLQGFQFLPPSIHLPPELRPVHGVVAAALPSADTIASTGTVMLHTAAVDHILRLADGQT